jgi:antitoxin MazE
MATVVKVRKWGNSLGVRLPKSFTSQRSIVDGTSIEISDVQIVDAPTRRRSKYKLGDILKNYTPVPKELDFPPAGKELA